MTADVPGFAGHIGPESAASGADKAFVGFLDGHRGQRARFDVTLGPDHPEPRLSGLFEVEDVLGLQMGYVTDVLRQIEVDSPGNGGAGP